MRIWPDTLPPASWPGLSLSPTDQSIRTDMEVGDPKVRRLTYAKRDTCDVMWRMTDKEFAAFRAWFGDDAYSLTGASDDLAAFSNLASSYVTDIDVGPDGQACDRIVENTSTSIHGISKSLSMVPANSIVTARASVKGFGRSQVRMNLISFAGLNQYMTADLTTGTIIQSFALFTTTIKQRPNGWWRIEASANLGSGASMAYFRLYTMSADGSVSNYAGDGVSGFGVCEQQARIQTGADLHLPTDATGNATGAAGGSAWFSMPMPLGNGLTTKQCQFIGTYSARPLPGTNWQVSARLRVR